MITKIAMGIGIIAALLAAEGSNRFGSFVSAFGGSDGGFYTMFLIISIVTANFFARNILSLIMSWLH